MDKHLFHELFVKMFQIMAKKGPLFYYFTIMTAICQAKWWSYSHHNDTTEKFKPPLIQDIFIF